MLHEEITEEVIQAFYRVNNTLGYGFLEKVLQQQKVKVYYEGQVVGDYESDLLVQELVIVETKAKGSLRDEHEGQLINYLKATNKEDIYK
ncbi:MAG: GxxExxY protein [bacterium]